MSACWTTPQTSTQVSITPLTYKSPLESESCIIKSLGETAYKETYKGVRNPTYTEHLKYGVCNKGEVKNSVITYYTKEEKIPKGTDACLRTVLGGGVYEKVRAGNTDVPHDLRGKVDRCFGVNPQAFEQARVYKAPDQVRSCLNDTLGETRFNEINSGASQPTEEERVKGSICFSKLNTNQSRFLPPPPEEVHYLETDPNIVELSDAVQETQKVNTQSLGGKLVFAGKSLANSNVYIYIYSTEPIVVTTKADDNGDWVYELNQPLNGEKHIAYAATRTSEGKYVRSSVFDFTVVAAETDLQNQLVNEAQLTQETGRGFIARVLVLAIVLCVTIILILSSFKALRKKHGIQKTEDNQKVSQNQPLQN